MKTSPLRFLFRGLSVLVLAMLWSGCTTPKVDWSARVGNYTLDQAILDLGPPDKQARLTDGTTVAEWLTRRGYNHLYGSPAYYPYWGVTSYPSYLDTYTPDYFLRLTFDAEGKLKAWKRFKR